MYHDVPPVWALPLLSSPQTQCRGRKERPWKSRVAVIHTWRNIRGRKRWTYEEVEKELHERDQEELDKKRDPEEPHKYSAIPTLCEVASSWQAALSLPGKRPGMQCPHVWIIACCSRRAQSVLDARLCSTIWCSVHVLAMMKGHDCRPPAF
jgi:hypothetical protein